MRLFYRYKGLFDETSLVAASQNGPSSPEFTKIVSCIVCELRLFFEIEEMVNETSGLCSFIFQQIFIILVLLLIIRAILNKIQNDRQTTSKHLFGMLISSVSSKN